jgi:dephospho-CoA kinase
MARGWESKSVEAQQADAAEKPAQPRSPLSPEQAARQRELENLRLSRQNVLQQLERIHDPRHRRMLEDALAELQRRMKSLEPVR